jgi:hypothetical protein
VRMWLCGGGERQHRDIGVQQSGAPKEVVVFVTRLPTGDKRAPQGERPGRPPPALAPMGPWSFLFRGVRPLRSFDFAYGDYSSMVYLADAGFDVFALDLQG